MFKKLALVGVIIVIALATLCVFSSDPIEKKTSPIEDMAMSAGY